jgi:predicted nucleic acid-binding Zn ribbon protein
MIDQVIDSLESRKRVRESLALVHWPRAVGPQAAAATEPETVRDGVLFVRTRSSAWSHELSLHKARILSNLTEALGEPLIRDIVFRASRGITAKPSAPPAEDPTPQELEAIELEPPEEAELQSRIRALRSFEDEHLREYLSNRLIRQARLRHWRLEHGWRLCRRCSAVHNEPEDLCPLCRLGL